MGENSLFQCMMLSTFHDNTTIDLGNGQISGVVLEPLASRAKAMKLPVE
jgi:hypothetical protein